MNSLDNGNEPTNLGQMLERLKEIEAVSEAVTIDAMMDAVGRRSFGPLILVVGLIAMSPLSGIPTLPSMLGVMVILIAGQLLVGRKHFWLPKRILDRSVPQEKLRKGLDKLRPVSRWVDRIIKARLRFLTEGIGAYVIAACSVTVGATMPPLEILPFLATTAGAALTLFGLALIANDGVLAIAGMLFTAGLVVLIVTQWPGSG